MWTTKLKLMHEDCHIVPRCKKFNVTSYAYPTGSYIEKGHHHVTGVHFLEGEEKNKKAFLRDLKRDKRIKQIEIYGDIYTYELDLGKKGEHVQLYYTPQIIFMKPVINSPEGFYQRIRGAHEFLPDVIHNSNKKIGHSFSIDFPRTSRKAKGRN